MSTPNSGKKPTKKASTKKPAKIKKSVLAEQERLIAEGSVAAQLEAERKEAERIKKEEAEAKAREDARIAAEIESERLHAQREFDEVFVKAREADLGVLEASVYEKTSWDKYLECNPLPDVTQESSLNTYLSMWREDDDTNAPNLRYKPLIESCSTTERVVDLLEEVNSEAREELQIKKNSWCKEFTHLLRNITVMKMDQLTAQFLARYDEFENHDTRVMNVAHNTPDIAFGLWVHNTAKRADGASVRVKRIEFPSIGFNIELPAALQKSRTSMRVIRTLYDHTSVHFDATINSPGSSPAANNSLTSRIRNVRLSNMASDPMHSDPPEMPGTEKDVFELARQAEELYASSLAAHGEQSLAAAAAQQPAINFVSVGGIINIEQLVLPPPPKKAKGWVMRDITNLSKSIQVVPYPAASDDSASNQSPAAAAAAVVAHGGALAGGTSQAPLRVSFMLPAYVFLDDREPHFGWWDSRHGCWRQEGVSLTKYEPKVEGGLVHLSLTLLKPVAIIQPRALDFPYRMWHLKPSGNNGSSANSPSNPNGNNIHTYELSLQGSRFPVEFEVANDHARLINPIHPVLGELNSQQMLPGILLNRMARAGINVQPSVEDAAYCRKPFKSLVLTAALHEHLAIVAGLFEISGSPFNSSRHNKKCLVRVKLIKDSPLLLAAADKRKRLDEELRAIAEEARARDLANGVGALDLKKADSKDADMEKMIAQMEADAADPAVEAAKAEEKAKAEKAAAEAAAAAALGAPTAEELEQSRQKRYKVADEWVTVMIELAHIDAPPKKKPKVQIQFFSQDPAAMAGVPSSSNASSVQGSPDASRPLTAAAPETEPVVEEVPEGTVDEAVPGGADLLKFTLIRGADLEGNCDENPLVDCVSHYSLRRCLLAYFYHLTPHDLTTALDMQLPAPPPLPPSLVFLPKRELNLALVSPLTSPTNASTMASPTNAAAAASATTPSNATGGAVAAAPAPLPAEEALPNPAFLLADMPTLQIQQTIRRILNLTNVFTFH